MSLGFPADKTAAEAEAYDPEEEVVSGGWTLPSVSLKAVDVKTGEEDEEVVWHQRSKLYRWAKSDPEPDWKERGLGESKLLRHKTTGRIRFLLRQEKSMKLVANFYVLERGQFCKLTANSGSEKIWVWTTPNMNEDGVTEVEQLALRFGNVEAANKFKAEFEAAAKANAALFDAAETEESKTTAEETEKPKAEAAEEPKETEAPKKTEEAKAEAAEAEKIEKDDK